MCDEVTEHVEIPNFEVILDCTTEICGT